MAAIASLIADPTRAEILLALMDGRSHPAGDLACAAHVSPATASHHLSRLVEGGLVEVVQQGRHRYHRLTGIEIAELLESLGSVGRPVPRKPPPGAAKLAYCRTCYDHLAGELAVQLREGMEKRGLLLQESDRFSVTPSGTGFFADLGIQVEELRKARRPLARLCIDWTERVPHLGGSLGAALLSRLLEKRWLTRVAGCRQVVVTPVGRQCLQELFCVEIRCRVA